MGRVLAVIPARLGSTRLPRKMLAADTGRPLVQHVADQASQATLVDDVVVATDSAEIVDALLPFGTRCVMTDAAHPSGTDRVAEVVAQSEGVELVLNVQGDEPEIEPATLDALVTVMRSTSAPMGTVTTRFPADMDVADPNRVKAVISGAGGYRRAVYFSRSPVPHDRDGRGVPRYLHLGVYAYRADFLPILAGLSPTPLEQAERLEQLRAIEHGHAIAVVEVPTAPHGIDTADDYAAFVTRWRQRQ